jgi:UDP-N-acetylmuramoyl-L-alanyl-D-glutamate--2,6-diaminopimelate ligase
VTLDHLLEEVDMLAAEGDLATEITGLCADSRRARPGDLFFAIAGQHRDGSSFVNAALAAGAAAVVAVETSSLSGAARVRVADPRLALAQAAGAFYDHPSRLMRVVAVTGTNGKTTTTYLLESIFAAAGMPAGVIGTTGVRFRGETHASAFTTPEAHVLQACLRGMVDARVAAVALEVSSHALEQRRSYGLDCDVAVFTNLSHDHLDYHGTIEAYLDAKLMLFDGRNQPHPVKHATAVLCADDPAFTSVREAARRGALAISSFGAAESADVRIADVAASSDGLDVRLETAGQSHALRVPLLGRYNALNAAAAFASARALGIDAASCVRGIANVRGVPGRLERVEAERPFDVVVDYAHTPDALARALAAAHEHARGRVLLVFGCGGDRDRAKRPKMGALAAAHADVAWVTNDNPRGEDPATIAREILAGALGAPLRMELDRRAAIGAALREARPGDLVLIAGKGHETTQTIGDDVLPFDDRVVAAEWLASGRPA